jgi:cation-transporting P-type ATPase F
MVPTQLLWLNMITALLLGLTLVAEPKEHDVMSRPPRDPRRPLLTRALLMRTGLVTLFSVAGGNGLFVWERYVVGAPLEEVRTAVVNVIIMVQSFYLLNCRSRTRSMFAIGAFSNRWLISGLVATWLAQAAFTYLPTLNRIFHTAPVRAEAWIRITAIGLTCYTAVGIEKWLRFRRAATTTTPKS